MLLYLLTELPLIFFFISMYEKQSKTWETLFLQITGFRAIMHIVQGKEDVLNAMETNNGIASADS